MKQTVGAVYENGVFRPVTLFFDITEGQRVILTVEPIVELDPEEYARRHAEKLRRMEAEGMLETEPVPVEGPKPEGFQPLVLEGEPLSETILKMRGE